MRLRAMAVWSILLIVAFINGFFREAVLSPALGPETAHVVSTLMLCAGILAAAYFLVPWIRPQGARDCVGIGALWLVLTLAFEFGFGRLGGRSWGELLADYDLTSGRVWVLVLIATALAPYLVTRLRDTVSPRAVP